MNKVISGKADGGEPCFEASLVAEDGVPLGGKPKSVYCYLTPKQLTIKSYLLRFIPRRLYTFRLVPATRITLSRCVTNLATRSMFYRWHLANFDIIPICTVRQTDTQLQSRGCFIKPVP